MAIYRWEKTDRGELDYLIDWTDWITSGEVIINAVWTVSDPALIIMNQEESDTVTTVWLDEGLPGVTYTVECTITTDSTPENRKTSRSFLLTVLDNRYLQDGTT